MTIDMAYRTLYLFALIALAILIGAMVIRSALGPRILDRIISINMIGTLVMTSLAIGTQLLDEGYLTDVALIYAMVSLLAVLILAAIYLPRVSAGETGENPSEQGKRKKKRRHKKQKSHN